MIIGRKKEQSLLEGCLWSKRAEFVAVYGRRRVGKTYLVREFFKDGFAFYAAGVARVGMRGQLRAFGDALREYGSPHRAVPSDWHEAFSRLRELLEGESPNRDRASGRLVVFLDELPWMDTPRSSFKPALELFWNSWASGRPDVMLVVCGSATSWVITNLIDDSGGFHNRVTRQIHLEPFTLGECEEYFRANNISFTRRQVVESYMVFGGVPYYLDLIDRRLSLPQNIDQLCFDRSGQLRNEIDHLYGSLFKNAERHRLIIAQMAKRRSGMTRAELAQVDGIGDGQPLTKVLRELEQCDFIRSYRDFTKAKEGRFYQLIDPFSLFALQFVCEGEVESWTAHAGTPGYYAWRGLAFEVVCLLHTRQMKAALGIAGVETTECSWRSREADPGVQIDLLISRRDGVVNICEMKFAPGEYAIDAAGELALARKVDAFAAEAAPDAALHLTFVTMDGVARNAHYGIVTSEVTAADLFAQ